MKKTYYALSVKQPWATLLVHGLKTIEVRAWSTQRRGLVLLHASRLIDERPEAWAELPAKLKTAAELRGGIIGVADLVDCIAYQSQTAFSADRNKHLNRPDWFRAPLLYGFRFERPKVLKFRKVPGWFRFFQVELAEGELVH